MDLTTVEKKYVNWMKKERHRQRKRDETACKTKIEWSDDIVSFKRLSGCGFFVLSFYNLPIYQCSEAYFDYSYGFATNFFFPLLFEEKKKEKN